jgi:hypothetical protein
MEVLATNKLPETIQREPYSVSLSPRSPVKELAGGKAWLINIRFVYVREPTGVAIGYPSWLEQAKNLGGDIMLQP